MNLTKSSLATLFATSLSISANATTQPNIVFLFADDISPREMPIYGSSVWSLAPQGGDTSDPKFLAKTPVIDQLARDGVWITSTWGATVCMPARGMLMTGRYATHTKWWDNRDFGKVNTVNGDRTWYLFESSPLGLGQIAAMGGYKSMWAGKTQMQTQGEEFQRFGFDEGILISGGGMGSPSPTGFQTKVVTKDGEKVVLNTDSGKTAPGYPMPRNSYGFNPHVAVMNYRGTKVGMEWLTNIPEEKAKFSINSFGPDLEADYAIDFMERQHKAGKPFFVYHATNLGHGDFDWINPNSGAKWPGTPKISWDGKKYTRTKPNITGSKGVYETHNTLSEDGMHAHIEYIDYIMWRYLEKTKELGIENNTIFIFSADNGSHMFGKGSVLQQRGVHVPLIIRAPKMTKQGEQKIIASLADILPTLADFMGVKFPENYELDGKSLFPYLTSDEDSPHKFVYSYKKGKQLIRSKNLIRDGNGDWWDASELPKNHADFKKITDWEKVPSHYKQEKALLEKELKKRNIYKTEYNAPTFSKTK